MKNLEFGSGISSNADSYTAGMIASQNAVSAIYSSDISCAVVFASASYDLDELLNGIADTLGDDVLIIGTTTAGEIYNGAQNKSVVVTIIASIYFKVKAAVGCNVSSDWKKAFNECSSDVQINRFFNEKDQAVKAASFDGKNIFTIIFTPGNTSSSDSYAFEILNEFNIRTGGVYPVIGGCSADDWVMKSNYVLLGRVAYSDSMLFAFVETSLKFGISMNHGFSTTNSTFVIGRSKGHEVFELNNKPAVDALAETMGVDPMSLEGKHISLTTGVPFGFHIPLAGYTICVASYASEHGGIRFSQPLKKGTVISIMRINPAHLSTMGLVAVKRSIIRGAINKPVAIFMFSCALRSITEGYSAQDEIETIKSVFPDVPVAGFFSFGEQAFGDDGINRHNNCAVTVLTISDELTQLAQIAKDRSIYENIINIQHQTALNLSSADNITDAFKLLMDGICLTGEFDSGSAYIFNKDLNQFDIVYHFGLGENFISSTSKYPADKKNMEVFQDSKPVYLSSKDLKDESFVCRKVFYNERIRSSAILPLFKDGLFIGIINMVSHKNDYTSESVKKFLETLIMLGGNIFQTLLLYEKIKLSEKNFNSLFEAITDFIFIVDNDGSIILTNRIIEERFEYTKDELSAMKIFDLHPDNLRSEAIRIYEDIKSGSKNVFNLPLQTKSGEIIPVETKILIGNWDGKNVIFGVSRDITDRKKAEQDLRTSLEEKNALLHEVHHRVKNNLQIISSLINLQKYPLTHDLTLSVLDDLQGRIMTMATVHEMLYKTGGFSKITLGDYIMEISSVLLRTFEQNKCVVDLQYEILYNMETPIKIAIPCGLILNELIINSIKYAFKERESGIISIGLTREDQMICIKYKDSGPGLPPDFDISKAETIGMTIIDTLVRQLKANLYINKTEGIKITIPFHRDSYED